MNNGTTPSASQHIASLDGLRGYAAAAVVLSHMKEFFHHSLPVEAGFLAVDLFFVMSGLVIEKSYGGALRSGSMNLAGFVRKRLVRLYPLYVLAGLIGCITYLRHPTDHSLIITAGASLASVLTMLPQGLFGLTRSLFEFNAPSWSLCIELFGGIMFAAISPRLKSRGLSCIVIISLAVLCVGVVSSHSTNLGWNWATFGYGVARFFFSYPLGILIWRHRDDIPALGSWAWPVVAIAMMFPALPGNDVVRILWVAILLPIGVVAALQIRLSSAAEQLCKVAGLVSYPLYIVHLPVLNLTIGALSRVWGLSVWQSSLCGVIGLGAIAVVTSILALWIEPSLRSAFDRILRSMDQRPIA